MAEPTFYSPENCKWHHNTHCIKKAFIMDNKFYCPLCRLRNPRITGCAGFTPKRRPKKRTSTPNLHIPTSTDEHTNQGK